jgi:hypothetical protein
MLLDTRNKNIYGLGVGISMVFEIFLVSRGTGPLRMVMTFMPSDGIDTKQEYMV